MAECIRVLHIVGAIYPGGMENFIMNLYENIDRDSLQFDIAVHARKENDYVERIEQMGGRVYVLPRLTGNPLKSLYALYRLVRTNHYPVVIRHTSNALVSPQLLAAKLAGAKTICHSHNETDPQQAAHKAGRFLMDFAVTRRLACSEKAGRWMFGKHSYEVIHNAIDIDKFAYSEEKRNIIRKEFNLGDARVYGHIANFIHSKNHQYLLRIYKEISLLDENARFFCVGEGDIRPEIEAQIRQLKLQDKVILTGIRNDVENFMSCFDVLIFPSFFEGLPLTLIEAQAAGLPVLMSDTITPDVIVSEGLVNCQSIQESPQQWAEKAVQLAERIQERSCQRDNIAKAGYDIKKLAVWYQEYIQKLAEG